jgi:hypothetical protein
MKRLTFVVAILLCLCSFNSSFGQARKTTSSKAPYKAAYTSSFQIGNPAYSRMILNLWKDWDDNQFDRHDYFADTVTLWLSDSMVVHGKKDAIEGAKKFRGAMSSAVSTVHAWVPLHSTDKGDDVVCIWGTEVDTYADGRVETRDLHEVWWINKAGKISQMREWSAKFGK